MKLLYACVLMLAIAGYCVGHACTLNSHEIEHLRRCVALTSDVTRARCARHG